MTVDKLLEGKLAYWQYRAVFTLNVTTTTTTSTVTITFAPGVGNLLIIDSFNQGPDDYATDRTTVVAHSDEDSNQHTRLISQTTTDNERLTQPSPEGTSTLTVESMNGRVKVLAGDDVLFISNGSLVDAETITISIRAYIKGATPTIATSLSNGLTASTDLAVSTTLNEVHM